MDDYGVETLDDKVNITPTQTKPTEPKLQQKSAEKEAKPV